MEVVVEGLFVVRILCFNTRVWHIVNWTVVVFVRRLNQCNQLCIYDLTGVQLTQLVCYALLAGAFYICIM